MSLVVLVMILEGFEVGFRGDEAVDSAYEVEVDGVFCRGEDAYAGLVHPFRNLWERIKRVRERKVLAFREREGGGGNLEGVEEAFASAEIVDDADELGDGDFVTGVDPVLEFWVDA